MLTNASYYAFTATPKNKTLEIFGEPYQAEGKTKHRPFHSYTMKQAIQEGFILDVLANYTPVNSYYRLVKTVEADPEFDARKANKKLRRYVENNDHAIRLKAEIMVDHFHDHVLALNKIGGQARAMVVTSSIERAIKYHFAIQAYLKERKSPYRDIVAFSGEPEFDGEQVTEAKLNGFPSREIADQIQDDPLPLPGLRRQVPDRLRRAAAAHHVRRQAALRHQGRPDPLAAQPRAPAEARRHGARLRQRPDDHPERRSSDYYRTTLLSEETDPNKLHDLQGRPRRLRGLRRRSRSRTSSSLYLGNAEPRAARPDPRRLRRRPTREQLDEDGQVDFKGKAKAFVRTYGFLAAILPYTNADWEKLSIFLNFLIPKLPAPKEEDLTRGILETIDMDSYRVEKQATMKIALADEDAEIDPVPTSGGGHMPEPELDLLSNIVKTFNEQWGNIDWTDADRVQRLIAEDIPARVAADGAYQNAMKNNDKQNARIEHDKALGRVMSGVS